MAATKAAGYQGFSDGAKPDADDSDDVTPPPCYGKGKPAAPAKKGGSKVLFLLLVLVLLGAAGGAGYYAFMYKPAIRASSSPDEQAVDRQEQACRSGGRSRREDPRRQDQRAEGDREDPTDPDDPETPVDPKPGRTDGQSEGRSEDDDVLPEVPEIRVPPGETPEKKAEPKKSALPAIEAPKFGPAPPAIKIDPEPDEPKDPKAAPDKKTVFDYVPSNAISFAVVRLGAFIESPSGAKIIEMTGPGIAKFAKETEDKLKLEPKDIRTVMVIALAIPNDPKNVEQSGVIVVETAAPFDAAGIEKEADSKSEVAGKTMYFKKNDPVGILLLSPTRIMNGTKEMVTALITGTPKAGPLSASLKEAAASKALFFAAFQTTPELAELREKGVAVARDTVPAVEAIAEATAGQITVSEDKSLKIALKLKYADADQAAKAKQSLEELTKQGADFLGGAKDMAKAFPDGEKLLPLVESALASVKPAVEGDTLTVPVQIDSTIGELFGTAMKMMPMGGPPKGPPPAPKLIETGRVTSLQSRDR